MLAIKETFDSVQVLVLSFSDPIELIDETPESLETTGTKSSADTLRTVLRSIAEGFSKDISYLKEALGPNKLEIEFGLGFSESARMWVLGVKGEQKLSVKMTWENN